MNKTFSQAARRTALLAAGLGLVSIAGFAPTPMNAQVSLSIRVDAPPPPPRHEVIVESSRPGPDFVWVGGYWDGAPGHYVWTPGHWDRPPHGHGVWVGPRWEVDHDGHYHQVKGEWR